MKTQEHGLVKAVHAPEICAEDQLEVAWCIILDLRIIWGAKRNVIEVELFAPGAHGCDHRSGIQPVEALPQRLREFKTRQVIIGIRKRRDDLRQRCGPSWYEYHVSIRRKYPAVVRIRSSHPDVACHRLKRNNLGLVTEALVLARTYPQDPYQLS